MMLMPHLLRLFPWLNGLRTDDATAVESEVFAGRVANCNMKKYPHAPLMPDVTALEHIQSWCSIRCFVLQNVLILDFQ